MGLTWRDLVSSVAVVMMVLAYWSFQFRAGLLLLTSAWGSARSRWWLGCPGWPPTAVTRWRSWLCSRSSSG